MMGNKTGFLFLYLALVVLLGCHKGPEDKTIRLAHGLDVNHSVHLAMVKMGEDLEAISDGKLSIKIYPNQQLGTERECLELLQIGSLDVTKVSGAVMENFSPRMRVFGLPFLFRDRQHAFNIFDGSLGRELLEDCKKFRLRGLGYYDSGSRSFYTKDKPINAPDDLKGLKIRVQESKTAIDMVRQLGGSPTPISWGEIYTSLQQGVIDGAENNPPSFYLSRHYEVCKYYTLDEHTIVPDVLVAGTHLWNRLTEKEKEWLNTVVKNSISYQRKLWQESEREALEEVQKAGVKIIRPDKQLFIEKINTVYDNYRQDKEIDELIKKIQSTH
ncbi:TRAP transporter substrate-binding protein [Spongiimicrobium sp. 2-473A-2-J]|uniref:TRAP transporter substrate-binding protein n=1 Tax=Eudoraea algarum TaxID=3417568 RepID=UPI003D369190